jgi:hypothetical protein
MSTTQTMFGEYDTVALREPLDGWPAGTMGVVQLVNGLYRTVEVLEYDDSRDTLDHIIVAQPEQLRLVRPAAAPS